MWALPAPLKSIPTPKVPKRILNPKTLGTLLMGSAAGGGTAHGVSQSYYSAQIEAKNVEIKLLKDVNDENEKHIKQQRDTIENKLKEIDGLKKKINTYNSEANHWHMMAGAADAKDKKRKLEWCRWYAPNGAAYSYTYSGNLGGKPMKFKHTELGCFSDGSY